MMTLVINVSYKLRIAFSTVTKSKRFTTPYSAYGLLLHRTIEYFVVIMILLYYFSAFGQQLLRFEFHLAQSQTQNPWYQNGYWPLVGAIAILVVTNSVSLYEVILSSRRNYRNDVKLKNIDLLSEKLNSFYNPLYSLLSANQSLFMVFGPRSFPEDRIRREAAAKIWAEIRGNVILPNNDRILGILEDQSHLLHDRDEIWNYVELINHLHSYKIFCEITTEIHNSFKFPEYIVAHVEAARSEVLNSLNSIRKFS